MEKTLDVHEQQAREKTRMYHVAPVLVLIVLAPALAEVLLGNLLINRDFVWVLVINTLLYGSGAILIREVAHRRHMGWPGVVALALAFGVVEEGLVLQSLFNQHFPGLEWMGSYGQVWGVNWFWAPYVLGLHTVWSITLPILLAESLFPRLQSRPWLGRVGLGVDAIVYILICLGLLQRFTLFTHFSAAPVALICSGLLVVLLISLALFVAPRLTTTAICKKAPAPWLAGLAAFLAATLFSGIFLLLPHIEAVPLLVSILLYVAVYMIMIILVWRWSTRRQWGARHHLALAAGALIETMLFGFLLVSRGSPADLIFHVVLCAAILLLLAWIAQLQVQRKSWEQL